LHGDYLSSTLPYSNGLASHESHRPPQHEDCGRVSDGDAMRIAINSNGNRTNVFKMIQIGRLELDLQARELRLDGARVRMGSRAFDILEVLVNAQGALVSKEEIFRQVWPETIVEENNLQVHMSALRKTLGEDRDLIITVPGRGYRFVGFAGHGDRPAAALPLETGFDALPTLRHNLPLQRSALFGRQYAIADVGRLLVNTPVVTLVGAGGIGKTQLGIEVSRQNVAAFTDGAWLVELASLTDPRLVSPAIAEACGLKFPGGTVTAERLGDALAARRLLLMLDNCEHLIDTVAQTVEILIQHNSRLRVLVTSREPLRIAGEQQYAVAPLDVPPLHAQADEILTSSAVCLFLARAHAVEPRLAGDVHSIEQIGEVCRRLDGIPLPIELAASRAATLGVSSLLDRLDDRLNLLTGGHRTALPRHQTLRATFDWSYAMLDPACQAVFRRLAVFTGSFTLEAACAVATPEGSDGAGTTDHISELVEKSLLMRGLGSSTTHFRLLESTRSYAFDRLDHAGERRMVSAAHASYMHRHLQALRTELIGVPFEQAREMLLDKLLDKLDDARAAIDWALSPDGDIEAGTTLSALVVPMLLDLALAEEYRKRTQHVFAAREGETVPLALSELVLGLSLHLNGEDDAARLGIESLLSRFGDQAGSWRAARFADARANYVQIEGIPSPVVPGRRGKLISYGRN
jgi:predicted ATPase/DNA-binding winged helix-turn-helix (wHTH) protein